MDNIVAAKWFKKRGVPPLITFLKGCNQVLTVARRVKAQTSKIPAPCPEIAKDYNPGVGGVDLLLLPTSCIANHLEDAIILDCFLTW